MSETFDLLLTGGTVLNPATKLNQKLDVGGHGRSGRGDSSRICRAAGRSA